jgi:putative transcriptional regulator
MTKVILTIDEVLKKRGRSAYWLANELGMGHGNLYKYRRGKVQAVNLELLARMCELLECRPGDLLTLSEGRQAVKKKR